MAFPIAHSLMGYATYRAGHGVGILKSKGWIQAAFFAFIASAPDLDYLPGVLVGRPLLFHHTVTHSLGATLACGLGVGFIAAFWGWRNALKMFLITSAVYFSHVIVDLFSPWPMPIFWPLQPVNLATPLQTFQSLPFCGEGVRNFACDLLRRSSDVRRFWREIAYLGITLGAFFLRFLSRRIVSAVKRPGIVLRQPLACPE